MRFKSDFFANYLKFAPLSLALERSMECGIYSNCEFDHPVLDLGCGDGLFAHMLFDERIDTGIDPNPRELKRAAQYGIYIEQINCRGDEIPKPDGSYKTIYSNSVLEHIPDLEPVLKEIHRLLSARGVFYVSVPTHLYQRYTVGSRLLTMLGLNRLSLRYEDFYNRFWSHYHCYSPDKWARIFEQCGFSTISIVRYGSDKTSLLCGLFLPLALWSWLMKRLFNRWILFPGIRRIYTWPLCAILRRRFFMNAIGINEGGLIFFKLVKI